MNVSNLRGADPDSILTGTMELTQAGYAEPENRTTLYTLPF